MHKLIMAADLIIEYPDGRIILIKRKNDPYKDHWALPGGMVEANERVEQAAVREAKEETGVNIQLNRIVGVYSDPDRDPRGRVVSVTYHASPIDGDPAAASDASDIQLTDKFFEMPLAFDHEQMLRDAFKKS